MAGAWAAALALLREVPGPDVLSFNAAARTDRRIVARVFESICLAVEKRQIDSVKCCEASQNIIWGFGLS